MIISSIDSSFINNESEFAIIREIYNGVNAHELFENELERALESGCETIVIEPHRLGEETARWIHVGNCLHSTSLYTGFGSILCAHFWPEKPLTYTSMAAMSLFCCGVYTFSWQSDPCIKYQVEKDPQKLWNIVPVPPEANGSGNGAPVVLVKSKEHEGRRRVKSLLHAAVTLIAVAVSSWRLFKLLRHAVAA